MPGEEMTMEHEAEKDLNWRYDETDYRRR